MVYFFSIKKEQKKTLNTNNKTEKPLNTNNCMITTV